MNEENRHIHILLERFFEGLTNNNEEQELYRFFKQDDIPEEFSRYQPVINYFASELINELETTPKSQISNPKSQILNLKSQILPWRKPWLKWISIAASFLFILFSSLYLLQASDPYEGSYIIRNGERITDLKLIRSDLIATERRVLSQLQEAEKIFKQSIELDDNLENQIKHILDEHNQRMLEN